MTMGSRLESYDAVIIPGGGLEPGTALPQPWVRARLDEAVKYETRTKYFIVLSRGTTHRPPPRDIRNFPIDEASASAKYLLENGVKDPSRILLDAWSLDTIGNAFFARQMLCDPLSLRKLLIITSDFHMPRTRAIFEWVFALDGGTAHLDFCATKDIGLSDAQNAARLDKERSSLRVLRENTVPAVDTIAKLSAFVFQQHGAYNATAAVEKQPKQPEQRPKCGMNESDIASTY